MIDLRIVRSAVDGGAVARLGPMNCRPPVRVVKEAKEAIAVLARARGPHSGTLMIGSEHRTGIELCLEPLEAIASR